MKNLGIKAAHFQGIGSRDYQEDSFAIVNSRNIFKRQKQGFFAIVCDGMGGLVGGKASSEFAVNQMCDALQRLDFSQNIGSQLANFADDISRALKDTAEHLCGTTLVAVHIFGNAMHFVSVGDSMILLKRDDFLVQLNEEHILFNDLLESELQNNQICVNSAFEHEFADRLTSFVGMGKLEKIDFTVRSMPLQGNDRILLCSDGVSKVLSASELDHALILSPDQAVKNMHAKILEKNHASQDNFTAIVLQIKE